MKFHGLKKYMAQDLIMLVLIGGILEVFSVKFGAFVFNGAPFACISLLIVFVAVVRWNFWGLLVAPFMALTAMLGGMWTDLPYIKAVYGWQMYLSTLIGLCVISLNSIIFIKFGTNKIISSPVLLVIMMIIDYLLVCVVQFMVYRLLTSGNLMEMANVPLTYFDNGEKTNVTVNVCKYGEERLIYNLFGFVVLIVGCFVLRSQGIVCNVKQKFVDDKINADLDRADEKFTIEEVVEEDLGEESSSSTETQDNQKSDEKSDE